MKEPILSREEVKWLDVVGYEDRYEVSDRGNLRSKKTGRILAKSLMGDGYVKADLCREGERKQTSLHRIVAIAFHGLKDGMEVNHIDGDKLNNSASNLEWVDRSSNVLHAYYSLGHKVIPVISTEIETGKETYYPSIEAAKRAGFRQESIRLCIYGRMKKTKGHHFRIALNRSKA